MENASGQIPRGVPNFHEEGGNEALIPDLLYVGRQQFPHRLTLWSSAKFGWLVYGFSGWKIDIHGAIFLDQTLHAMKQVLP